MCGTEAGADLAPSCWLEVSNSESENLNLLFFVCAEVSHELEKWRAVKSNILLFSCDMMWNILLRYNLINSAKFEENTLLEVNVWSGSPGPVGAFGTINLLRLPNLTDLLASASQLYSAGCQPSWLGLHRRNQGNPDQMLCMSCYLTFTCPNVWSHHVFLTQPQMVLRMFIIQPRNMLVHIHFRKILPSKD